MQQSITYNCTALVGTNKVGELTKSADGYYEMVLGALQAYNSAGAFYPLQDAKALFESTAPLMRRIGAGALRGEVGHPRYQEGMSERAWFARVNDIFEPNCCVHFASVSLSYDSMKDKKGRPVVAMIGKIKPSGANERFLERQLENPKENVCFSIRCFTHDTPERGVMMKRIKHIVTWDYVNEPGIDIANKYSAPALESYQEASLDDYRFDLSTVAEVAKADQVNNVGMESAASNILQMVGYVEPKIQVFVPKSLQW